MLKNKIAVVTGANGGIGLEVVRLFIKNNAKVFACVRSNKKAIEKLKSELEDSIKNNIEIIELDFQNENSVKQAASKIISKTNTIDILVNNAGQIFTSSFLMTPIKKIKELFEVNFFSQLLFTQYIAKKMIKNKKGSIINISSSSAFEGNEGRLAYAASKSALSISSKVLARELSSFNIRCNTVAPGLTDTNMMRESHSEEIIKDKIESLLINRVAKPIEIANSILFLASDESSYINGETIRVDGGMT